ncbi:MAG: SpvB/TcaC N-terminal domain-containing protein, partial [candidate division Zixibacteria bacterium]|nr:SpvB/TcaC N-terminal domain-containing protein [candidate division Zixibacteria bacterium]
ALAVSCGRDNDSGRDLAAGLLAESAAEGPGYDALSSSTNRWSKEELLAPKIDPLAGAAYVKPPSVGNFGAVGLSYPVDVPAGRAGMRPSVALAYSSSGGDGVAGIGWSLATGLGAIARDTGRGELFYDHRDVFAFNGKRMIKVGGPAGTQDGAYRLEIESGFSRFELSDSAHGGVWRVYDKAGAVTLYGADLSSRTRSPDDDNRTYIWNFSQSTDLNGNFMYAEYDDSDYRDNHVLYLKEIRYTGNEREGLPARQWVRFAYKRREDAYVSRAPGFIMRMDRLLDVISVGWDSPQGERELWRYEPVYRASADSKRPLLETIRSTRHSTAPVFEYREADHYFIWRNAANPFAGDPGEADDIRHFEGDFNGDGLSDMAFFNPETGEWKAAEVIPSGVEGAGGGYAAKTYGNRFRGYGGGRIGWFKGGATGDYNGDGRSDIPFYIPETRELWVAEHNGVCFDFRPYGRYGADVDPAACEWFTGDFDGNALSDVLLFNEPTGRWTFMRNAGGSFGFIELPRHFRNLFRDDYAPDSSLNSGATSDTSPQGRHRDRAHFICGDYNGDGRTDVSLYDSRSGAWWVGENYRVTGDGDRGSGTVDFELRWILYKTFKAPEQALFANDRFSGDYNGDGLSDFLVLDRASGEWWLGETGDRSISFRMFSRAPKFREITRWLQGDFNGDGRTDIGFYSSADGGFWIGEAEPDGFRYRAYTNLRDCPDPARILAAPLPRDEVTIADGRTVVPGAAATEVVAYRYDGNSHTGRGELVFAGRFTPEGPSTALGVTSVEGPALSGAEGPELLIYNRGERRFYLKRGAADPVPALDAPGMEADGARVLFDGRPRPYRGRYGVLYYRPERSFIGGTTHMFSLVSHTGTGFSEEGFASFNSGIVCDFDIGKSLYRVDRFAESDPNSYLLALDDRRDEPDFVLFDKDGAAKRLSISGTLDSGFFRDARSRAGVRMFSCVFAGEGSASLVLIDFSSGTHRWHRGRITPGGDGVSFEELSSTQRFYNEGFLAFSATARGSLTEFVYAASAGGRVSFHRLMLDGGRVLSARDYTMAEQVSFKGDFDHEGRPVVFDGATAKRVVLEDGGHRLEAMAPEIVIGRPDLMKKVYPFRWLQGDYNGDGKTDIGFFHLKERNWYFALTQGAVPDLLTSVKNGIGGSYEMEYANSSGFDNTGGDGVPDLPVNYRVCSQLEVSDGLGRSVVTRYGYRDGCAFSAFVNGARESDYFGFGEFTVVDAYGARAVSRYHAMPYDDFRMNRALAGAIRETRRIGSDHVEYERIEHDYTVRVIEPSPPA